MNPEPRTTLHGNPAARCAVTLHLTTLNPAARCPRKRKKAKISIGTQARPDGRCLERLAQPSVLRKRRAHEVSA